MMEKQHQHTKYFNNELKLESQLKYEVQKNQQTTEASTPAQQKKKNDWSFSRRSPQS